MIKIQLIEKVNGTKAMPILVEAWSYLMNNKLCPNNQWPLAWDMNALVALDGAKVVGVIGFTNQEWTREVIINIGYVVPVRRRQGIYTKLWKELVAYAKKKKVPTISTGTLQTNLPVLEFYKKTRRPPTRVFTEWAVPGVKSP